MKNNCSIIAGKWNIIQKKYGGFGEANSRLC